MLWFFTIPLLTIVYSEPLCPLNCEFCISLSICQKCNPHYNLFTNNTCINSLPLLGCQLYTTSGNCAKCSPSYIMYKNICHPPVAYCDVYSAGARCERCITDYLLFEGQCFEKGRVTCPKGQAVLNSSCIEIKVLNCLQFNSTNCLKCASQYSLLNGFCVSVQFSKDCATKYQNNTCSSCQQGQLLLNTSCGRVKLDNCLISSGFICLQCNGSDYILTKGVCLKILNSRNPYCLNFDLSTSECVKCHYNYSLDDNKICVKIKSNCLTSDLEDNYLTCVFPMTIINKKCVYSDSNCTQPVFETHTCKACKHGYKLQSNGKTCHLIDGCNGSSKGVGCSKCISGYFLLNSSCYLIPSNCKSLNSSLVCDKCKDGSQSVNEICVFVDSACLLYSQQTGYCIKCNKNFTIDGKGCVPLPNNCLEVNSEFKCIQCENQYDLRSGVCVKLVPNCLYYYRSKCIECEWYYYISKNGSCLQYPTLCNMVDINGICISCEEGLTLYFGKCVYYQTFCNNYSDEVGKIGSCSLVALGFDLSKNWIVTSKTYNTWDSKGNILTCKNNLILKTQMCVSLIPQCIVYDQFQNCQQCQFGYALNENKCIIDNLICKNKTNKLCQQCISGFVIYNMTCVSIQNNVLQFDTNGKPLRVRDGYITNSKGISISLPINCRTFVNISDKCTECVQSYKLDSNGNCIKQVPNCLQYNIFGLCQSCSEGLLMIRGMCRNISLCSILDQTQCRQCKQGTRIMSGICIVNFKESNCYEYDLNFTCMKCRYSFYLWNNRCLQKPLNCNQVNSSSGSCLVCRRDYHLFNSTCVPSTENCQKYSNLTNLCSKCLDGYSLLKNFTCYLQPPLCAEINKSTFKCSSCLSSYILVLNQTRCARIITNCLNYYLNGDCAQCQTNYNLSEGQCFSNMTCLDDTYRVFNNTCIKKTLNCLSFFGAQCNRCISGYYLDFTFQCVSYPIGCTSYILQIGCTKCTQNYKLQNNSCKQYSTLPQDTNKCLLQINKLCQKCSDGYTLVDNHCIKTIDKCTIYSSSGNCLACSQGMYVGRQNKCQLISKNCIVMNSFGLCLKCNVGYIISQKYCILNMTECSKFNIQDGSCAQCKNNLTLYNGSMCINSTSNCNLSNSDGKCTNCNSGFSLTDGFCFKFTLRCTQYFPNNGSCSDCQKGYYLNSTFECRMLPPNCQQVNTLQQCTKCSSGSFVYQKQCIKLISNCSLYDFATGFCIKCIKEYSLIQNNCIRLPSNCQTVSSSGICSNCSDGYVLLNSLCQNSNLANQNQSITNNSLIPITPILNYSCQPGYYLVAGRCYKIIYNYPIQNNINFQLIYSSLSSMVPLPCIPKIGSLSWWQPQKNLTGEWVGYSFSSSVSLQSFQIQGNGMNSWISKFIIKYRENMESQQLKCVNNCNLINGISGPNDLAKISFSKPLTISELRIYPQEWSGYISCRIEVMTK